jgi:hypothetical protein
MSNDRAENVPSKVFLRRTKGLYYTLDGGWTLDRGKARDFEEAAGALIFARASDLPGLEIVIVTKDGESSLAIAG